MNVVVVNPSEFRSARQNYFDLFGIPKQFKVDLPALEKAYLLIQQEVHPDRHATSGDAQKRVALQMATLVNTAYQTLRHPLKRGFYLCELEGLDPKLETNTSMPTDFLMQQMAWRESMEDAQSDLNALEILMKAVQALKKDYLNSLEALFDESKNLPAALEKLRAALFIDRFADELDDKIADLAS
jgi:molecular chaperone HscB